MTSRDIAVVGGGFAGLGAATVLAAAGHRVTIFEKEACLGGLASGFREPHWSSSVERYYHHWFASDVHVQRFAQIWGVSSKIVFRVPSTAVETTRNGFVALDSALALLRYPELPFVDRLRMGLVLAYLKSMKNGIPLERETAEAWCRRWMGDRGYDAIWKPLLIGKFGSKHAKDVNMAWLWARLSCRTRKLGTYEGGFAALVADAERWLGDRGVSIVKSCGDLKATRPSDQWVLEGWGQGGAFDQVIVAAAPSALQSIFGVATPEARPQSDVRRALGIQVVLLSLRRSLGSIYWYSLRKSKDRPFLAVIEHTRLVEPAQFGGEHLVYAADYVDVLSDEWGRTDQQLLDLAWTTCRYIEPRLSSRDLLAHWVFRDPYAQPVVGVGASRHLPPIRVPGLSGIYHGSLAHVYPWDRGTNFALELGEKIAAEVLRDGRGAH